ncbi:MAG: hypothetical protein M3441_22800 [Chloroflexota bacterium]|nr:hypothetical protein [Chloroflexota bacterium]
MGFRQELERLKRAMAHKKLELVCPVCYERFVVYGREPYDPAVNFLLFLWKEGYQGGPYREPPEDIRRVAEHEHDASEFIDTATGDPWLGELFRGVEHECLADVPDLSEQAEARAGSR